MKYLKTFEKIYIKDIDYNKIYAYYMHIDKSKECNLIGKLIKFENRTYIIGYVQDRELSKMVYGYNWNRVREATPDEIDSYNMKEKIKKYNI